MSANATAEERMKLAHAILETMEEMDFDPREMSTILVLALAVIWTKNALPIELFDQMMAAASRQISIELNEKGSGKPS